MIINVWHEKLGEITFDNKPSEFPNLLKDVKKYLVQGITHIYKLEDVGGYGRSLAVTKDVSYVLFNEDNKTDITLLSINTYLNPRFFTCFLIFVIPLSMYNRFGERVREGIGWIGDLGTGNGTLGSRMEETDTTEIYQHPGNGNAKGKDKQKNTEQTTTTDATVDTLAGTTESNVESTNTETTTEELTTVEEEPTPDITTDLVKENPYRYAGYYFDRKTQNYYLYARYYNPRIGRFISLDPLNGKITNPLSINRYVYGTTIKRIT